MYPVPNGNYQECLVSDRHPLPSERGIALIDCCDMDLLVSLRRKAVKVESITREISVHLREIRERGEGRDLRC